ncbi:hypothetical protein [Anaeromassilibacillus senegalensis]|uniref:hypothetical protein n=1 Tax=Anaeromassilibacillus senegalensis TaxID=1673717 RepID=UPI0006808C90|nr:hypothetical protein [Anaeromassilibacillus senegalensis]
MKKVWALLLTAILVIGCVGCGSPSTGNGDDAAGLNNNSQDMASGMDGEADASWDKVEQAGKRVLGPGGAVAAGGVGGIPGLFPIQVCV